VNIFVLVKAVADSEATIRPAADGKNVNLDDVTWVVNPFDEYAVEEALKLKEADGSGEVTVISYGGDEVPKVIRTTLAMGVDKGIHIKGPRNYDALATARAINNVIKDKQYDLLLCGKSAIDHDNHSVGIMIAEMADIPSVSFVVKLEKTGNGLKCEREVEGGLLVVATPLPAVVTCQKGLNEPRYASLKGIMAAKKKPLDEVAANTGDVHVEVISIEPRPPRAPGEILGEGVDAIPLLIKKLKEEAKVL
jgi:electron transfer flavoprotein beta subunit